MKKIVYFAMAMLSLSNVNASVVVPAESSSQFTAVYNYDSEKVEYEVKNDEVVSKVVYKWNAGLKTWKPCMKYAISKNAETTILSCGHWNENTKDFSSNISLQSFATADSRDAIALPGASDNKR